MAFFFFAGVGLVVRKMGNAASPVVELTKNGDEYTLTSQSTFKNTTTVFKLGEEFEEETPDGRKVKAVVTQEGNKLIHVQKGEKETTIIREFSEDELKMVSSTESDLEGWLFVLVVLNIWFCCTVTEN